ncbi:GNAT family N-acetyltransferase [Streptomyces sp. ALI-76-A]|jgi:RimJ/RimL family protein N-acetyltransferase|uniref:GNAT family N-acetyltransferase n=1 Tax=Streptomyces sp. ALI-76-A TaxID=3025736 RepID=UPI00256EC1E5|nr:GNAT family N-acetyltransferase [Streptomyces sp. ALI-76-A]MDL5199359.1 GNAT family N-acetyltransferase [Streptomyces sp. ALI-76-A]
MDITAVRLAAPATPTAPALRLRPWCPGDAAGLAAVFRDDGPLRRWVTDAPHDEAGALRWVRERRRLWESGECFSFAVVETHDGTAVGRPSGHVVLKRGAPGGVSAEVGYWTAAHARGRGIAPRALRALTDWAFTARPAGEVTRLDLLHQVDNTASCRVADKCGYTFSALLPAAPPAFPLDGHRHVRVR